MDKQMDKQMDGYKGYGWYRVTWSDGGMDYTSDGAVWLDGELDFRELMEGALEEATEWHLPAVYYYGDDVLPSKRIDVNQFSLSDDTYRLMQDANEICEFGFERFGREHFYADAIEWARRWGAEV